MPGPSNTVLVVLLVTYGAGVLWVIGVLWLTVMKFTGLIRVERPRWIFQSVQRAMTVVLFSAAMVVGLDIAVRAAGVL